jgi:two-component system chemotaxis response regulator CheB
VSQIRVMVVDDSAFMRQVITKMLERDVEIQVVAFAVDGLDALNKLEVYKPDVVTLDMEMPRMDGLTCLERLMSTRPCPVVMVSSWAIQGAEQTLRALELGAVDFVTKPSAGPSDKMWDLEYQLVDKVKAAARVKVDRLSILSARTEAPALNEILSTPSFSPEIPQIVAIGASTGGPRALQSILTSLRRDFPVGIVIAQHMPKDFTRIFADRLNAICALYVKEAQPGDKVEPGVVLVAPSGRQMEIRRIHDRLMVEINDAVSIYRPSVDILFSSLTTATGSHTLAVLLTGMGGDGARGMKSLRDLGARTITESEETCIVYGMPRVANELGASEISLPLPKIPEAILKVVKGLSL